jgi:putative hydrolase of HD superfamily
MMRNILHLAIMAILLSGYAVQDVDLFRVLKMVLVHDLVEIDAGDTFCYNEITVQDQAECEQRAANRIFGLLPTDQAGELRAVWEEFEARRTPEACFAAALDRLQPLLHNYWTQGGTWKQHGITQDKVMTRNQVIASGSPTLWEFAESLVQDAVDQGFLLAK